MTAFASRIAHPIRAAGEGGIERHPSEVVGLERLADRLDAELARDLAGGVAPHPVGDDEHVVIHQRRVRVFVVLSLQPRIRLSDGRHEDERVRPGGLLFLFDVDRHLGRDVDARIVADLGVGIELGLVVVRGRLRGRRRRAGRWR